MNSWPPTAGFEGNTQTCYLLGPAIRFAGRAIAAAGRRNISSQDIAAKKDHLSTGFVGVGYLLPVLTHFGYTDVAYRLLNQDTFPSWLFPVKHGATTIWERWDGWTPDKGFETPRMNSFNHYSLGSCGQWMYDTIAGIGIDEPGFKHIIIRPRPGGGLTWARASYESGYGTIKSDWRIAGNSLKLSVSVPANTSATIYVPTENAAAVREGDRLARTSSGVSFVRVDGRAAVFEVGSGDYVFTSPW